MGPAALQCKPGDERSAIGLRRQLLVQHVQEMESGLRAEGQHPEIIRVDGRMYRRSTIASTGLSSPARLPERTGGEEQAQQQLQLRLLS